MDTVNQGINIPDITLVVQYQVPRELSTWIQWAGQAAHDPTLQATAILIAEPSYFDDEKEKVAQKTAERNRRKRWAEGQLQPSTSQHPRVSLDSHQRTDSITDNRSRGILCPGFMLREGYG